MAKQVLNKSTPSNRVDHVDQRNKINDNFTELYDGKVDKVPNSGLVTISEKEKWDNKQSAMIKAKKSDVYNYAILNPTVIFSAVITSELDDSVKPVWHIGSGQFIDASGNPVDMIPEPEADVFINTLNAFQGATTPNEFTVAVKMMETGSAQLAVYSDEDRLVLVKTTAVKATDSTKVVKFTADGLTPNTQYYWSINSGGQKGTVQGSIKTHPSGASSYKFIAASCAGTKAGNYNVFDEIRTRHGDSAFFMMMGDLHYLDISENTVEAYDAGYDWVLNKTQQQNLYKNISLAYMFDDHDYMPLGYDGADSPTREVSLASFKKRTPHYELPFSGVTAPVCYTFKVGRVRYVMLDSRSQRVKNVSFLGTAQKNWLKNLLLTSNEEALCLMVGVPWISNSDTDTWFGSGGEKQELMKFFSDYKLDERMFMIAGDAHMVAIDNGTNNGRIPMFQFAALSSNSSEKGGPYSEGVFLDTNQFGTVDITDTGGETLKIKGTGWRVKLGVETELVSLEKTYNLKPKSILAVSPISGTYIEFGQNVTINMAFSTNSPTPDTDPTQIEITSPLDGTYFAQYEEITIETQTT